MGLFDFLSSKESARSPRLNFTFESADHLRYEGGQHVSGPHGGARRAVKVEPNITGGEGYSVTIFNLDGIHPLWQNNVQVAPKQMKVVQDTPDKVVLRGFGQDEMGTSFAGFGLTVTFQDGRVNGCTLHMHDRGVDLKYLP